MTLTNSFSLHLQQLLGAPLYWFCRDWYYAWQALVKQWFILLVLTVNNWLSPTIVRVCGDESVRGQIRQEGRRIVLDFSERTVLIANHQVWLQKICGDIYMDLLTT